MIINSSDHDTEMKVERCDDYRALAKSGKQYGQNSNVAHKKDGRLVSIASIERFFKSDYFTMLSNVDGNWILRRLQEDIKNEQCP